ncbi:MAG: tetratricopeptide repeat protein [Candidatus Aminicenantes bacterium]|nr:tetratricopeptide repeat protein [Candidatus Aminicenantes bacterium]
MTNVKKVEIKTVSINTALIIGLIALLIGFFGGNIYNAYKSDSSGNSPSPSMTTAVQDSARMFALEQQLKSNPNNAAGWMELGNLYFDSNKPQDAIRAYTQYLSINPNNANVLTDLGVMYRRSGNSTEAIASFDKAIGVDPRHEHARFNKGIVLYYDVGFQDEGVKVWEELSKINPNFKTPDGKTITDLLKNR